MLTFIPLILELISMGRSSAGKVYSVQRMPLCGQLTACCGLMMTGVALLPFVDESRLLRTLDKVYPNLTLEEGTANI